MLVFITGGTGFVGQHIVDHLLKAGHSVRCLVRNAPDRRLPDTVEQMQGDVLEPASLTNALEGVDAVIHLVGIIEEKPNRGITFDALHHTATANVVKAARRAGVDTWIQMSANGARENGVSAYQTSKWKAEQVVKSAGFDHWTIFRPSLVFGKPGNEVPEFASQLVNDLIKPFPVWPIFGDGLFAMQPIHVQDVARAFVVALGTPAAHGKVMCLSGPEAIPFRDILGRIASGAGVRHKPMIPQPLWLMRPVVSILGGILLPISSDQLEMLVEGNTCDGRPAADLFGLKMTPFNAEELSYLKEQD
jgi:NADH dehydrogenase